MSSRFLLRVICCVALLIPVVSQAQQTLLNGQFKDITFRAFVTSVESATPYRFYYPPAADTLKVNTSFHEKPLSTVLLDIFKDTEFKFAIDPLNRVFITRGIEIQPELPPGYFGYSSLAKNQDDAALQSFLAGKQRDQQQASLEDKLFIIGSRSAEQKGNPSVAGYVRNIDNGEPIVGAVVMIENPFMGTATDAFGYFSLSLPKGRYELKIKSLGMKTTRRQIMLYSDGKLDIEMKEDIVSLKEIVIESEKDANVTSLQMGKEKLDIKLLKQIPSALGETDVLRTVLTLPGVQSVGEGTVGINVRGGSTSQNLILYNDATIYNPSHLFGFFSTFNPDILKNVELYKSGIPAEYGGRLASILEVTTREGNKKKFSGSGGISPITGRFMIEGPIVSEKTSFILSGRSTYSNWILSQLPNETLRKSAASFYDINALITHQINDKNSLQLSGYFSDDKFKLGNDTSYHYTNRAASAKWKHIFSNRFFGIITGSHSGYDYAIDSKKNPLKAFELSYGISQNQLKADFNYFLDSKHTITFGASSIYYHLQPGTRTASDAQSIVTPVKVQNEQAVESALYVSDRFEVTPKLSLTYGLRYSIYSFLGPKNVYRYQSGVSFNENTIIDTVSYTGHKPISTYHGPELRLAARYALPGAASVKFSYNRMRQYIQMLSNTTAISPTDIWKLSDQYVKPQIGDQISAGYYRNFRSNTIEVSAEAYYKLTKNFIDYKGGATLLLNTHIETDLVSTKGHSYGIEFMLRKLTGKLNGWVTYTYSRSLLQTTSSYTADRINNGRVYPSNFDKPHSLNLIGNYKFNRRFSISVNYTYSTGRPITLPLSRYDLNGAPRLFYSDRNEYRIPDYWRADVSLNIEGNHKIRKLAHSSWTLALYNITGRRNAYSVYFVSQDGKINGYKLSIFGNPIPTLTYNFRF
ncbi:MAG: TonB-dependent receptor [Cyclobacteriaceae bacterium]